MWIQFASNAYRVNANSIRIQTESNVKGPLIFKGTAGDVSRLYHMVQLVYTPLCC